MVRHQLIFTLLLLLLLLIETFLAMTHYIKAQQLKQPELDYLSVEALGTAVVVSKGEGECSMICAENHWCKFFSYENDECQLLSISFEKNAFQLANVYKVVYEGPGIVYIKYNIKHVCNLINI